MTYTDKKDFYHRGYQPITDIQAYISLNVFYGPPCLGARPQCGSYENPDTLAENDCK